MDSENFNTSFGGIGCHGVNKKRLSEKSKNLSDLRVHLSGLCVKIQLNAENAETYAEFAEILIPHITDENR